MVLWLSKKESLYINYDLNIDIDQYEKAVLKTLEVSNVKTADLGGTASTTEFTEKIIENL